MSADVTLTEDEREALLEPCACGHTVNDHGSVCWLCGDEYVGDARECRVTAEDMIARAIGRILADRLAQVTARAERAEAQVERVQGLHAAGPGPWTNGGRIESCTDCHQPWPCRTVRAALAETETGHQTRSGAPRSAEEADSRVPGPDGVREAGRRAGAIVDSEGAW